MSIYRDFVWQCARHNLIFSSSPPPQNLHFVLFSLTLTILYSSAVFLGSTFPFYFASSYFSNSVHICAPYTIAGWTHLFNIFVFCSFLKNPFSICFKMTNIFFLLALILFLLGIIFHSWVNISLAHILGFFFRELKKCPFSFFLNM